MSSVNLNSVSNYYEVEHATVCMRACIEAKSFNFTHSLRKIFAINILLSPIHNYISFEIHLLVRSLLFLQDLDIKLNYGYNLIKRTHQIGFIILILIHEKNIHTKFSNTLKF